MIFDERHIRRCVYNHCIVDCCIPPTRAFRALFGFLNNWKNLERKISVCVCVCERERESEIQEEK